MQASIFVVFSLRYLIVLNVSWLISSSHFIWGLDKNHKPSDSNMIFLVTKSYWPQYHYLLPFDYQTGEFGNYGESRSILFLYCVYYFYCVCVGVDIMNWLRTRTKKRARKIEERTFFIRFLVTSGLHRPYMRAWSRRQLNRSALKNLIMLLLSWRYIRVIISIA